MDTPQEIRDRYKQVETVTDKFGRAIMVGRLRPSQQLKVSQFAEGGDESIKMNIRFVCMVREIDGDQLSFPRSRAEVDARIDRLEDEGLDAIVMSLPKLFGADTGADADPTANAKN